MASLAAQAAIAICKSLVNMTAPPFPLHLAALQAPKPSKRASTTSQDADNEEDSERSGDDELEADDKENVEVPCTENEDGRDAKDISSLTAAAAIDTARYYPALCTHSDTALVDARTEHSGPLPAPVPRPTNSSSGAASELTPPQDLRSRLYVVGSIVIRAAESPLLQRRPQFCYFAGLEAEITGSRNNLRFPH
ncbi:hypothetical protein AURDEDRAFT_177052 [Auricularia subglabra TFB-10046 SS5]|uniref:Uncharacterized protein n=1 Tax=Auricularia subglabra (strain TFB-10046 / SS5) TaxID=717982 RepID=J0WPS7_AURST|nr:hypothetical protein AURDEDRAFT_177052 [Auricularia subglabra TFB-10046 SS5]